MRANLMLKRIVLAAGMAWMDDWITGDGARADSLTHFSWHAALHELSTGDLDAVRRRYDAQLRPTPDMGCRSLVDPGRCSGVGR